LLISPEVKTEQEEIFGPVLAVIKAAADTLEIANDTEFGLTGAVYATRAIRSIVV
jgi:acyl-CoA reductase-like NAD-dependent aldehyde dehydrogenase